MYSITLKYYLSGVLTDTLDIDYMIANEEDLQLTFGRNALYEGVHQEFSGTFIFIKSDRQWIIDRLNDYITVLDEETKIVLELSVQNPVSLDYNIEYTGRIRWDNVEIQEYYIQCEFEDDSLINKVDKKRSIVYTIEQDGDSYDYPIRLNAVYNAHSNVKWNDRTSVDIDSTSGATGSKFKFAECIPTVNFIDDITIKDDWTRFEDTSGNPQFKVTPQVDCESIVIGEDMSITVKQKALTGTNQTLSFVQVSLALLIYENNSPVLTGGQRLIQSFNISNMAPNSDYTFTVNNGELADISGDTMDRSSDDEKNWTRYHLGIFWNYPADEMNNEAIEFTQTIEDCVSYMDFGSTEKTSKIYGDEFSDIVDDFEGKIGIGIDIDDLPTLYQGLLTSTARGIKGFTPIAYNFSFEDLVRSVKKHMAYGGIFEGSKFVFKPFTEIYGQTEYNIGEAVSIDVLMNEKVVNTMKFGNGGSGSVGYINGNQDWNSAREYAFDTFTDNEEDLTGAKFRVDSSALNKAAIDSENTDTSGDEEDTDKDVYIIARDISQTEIRPIFDVVYGVSVDEFGNPINMEFSPSRQIWNWRNYIAHSFTETNSLKYKSHEKNRDLVYNDTERGSIVVDTPDVLTNNENATSNPPVGSNIQNSGENGIIFTTNVDQKLNGFTIFAPTTATNNVDIKLYKNGVVDKTLSYGLLSGANVIDFDYDLKVGYSYYLTMPTVVEQGFTVTAYYTPSVDFPILDGNLNISSGFGGIANYYFFYNLRLYNEILPIFGRRKFLVTLPYKTTMYSDIKANANNKFVVMKDGVTYKGYLESAELNPIKGEQIEIELTESYD